MDAAQLNLVKDVLFLVLGIVATPLYLYVVRGSGRPKLKIEAKEFADGNDALKALRIQEYRNSQQRFLG